MTEKELKDLLKQIEKDYGKGTIMNLDDKALENIEVISTGSLLLNRALGVGGYPRGRIIEIFGPESSGKTTMALHAIAQVQKSGGIAAFIDAEHALDVGYAKRLGIDLKKIIISQPDSGEQALELVDQLVNSSMFDLVVIDSVAALVPLAELEGTMEDQQIGLQARMMAKSMRKLSASISKTNTTVLFINQIREKVGVIFGSPEITPGGRALKFFATIRLDIRARERIKKDQVIIGQRVKIKVVKNKVAAPYKEIETEIYYENGIDIRRELLNLALLEGVILRKGLWYFYNEKKLGQTKKEVLDFLDNKENYEKVNKSVFK